MGVVREDLVSGRADQSLRHAHGHPNSTLLEAPLACGPINQSVSTQVSNPCLYVSQSSRPINQSVRQVHICLKARLASGPINQSTNQSTEQSSPHWSLRAPCLCASKLINQSINQHRSRSSACLCGSQTVKSISQDRTRTNLEAPLSVGNQTIDQLSEQGCAS